MSNEIAEIEEATPVATKTSEKDDGPTIIRADGRKEWHRNGNLHRDDGPAIDNPQFKAWYKDGLLHRVGGPAIITSAYETWWENGVFLGGRVF